MVATSSLDEYLTELRQRVCSRCIARQPGGPPCERLGVGCGIEQHVGQLVEICRSVDSVLIDPYLEQLERDICATCAYRDTRACPCPLRYLLPLAVEAVEAVNERHRGE